jgi:hypothetical protein
METQFVLGMTVSCSDGSCGVVRRMILDPDTRAVTHLAVGPRHHSVNGRLVPLALADVTDGEIRLKCTTAEFERLDHAEEIELMHGAGFEVAETAAGYGDVESMGVGAPGPGPRAILSDAVPPGETDLTRHERVHAADGEIGQIKGFVVHHGDHKVTHLLLKEGHLWGRKEVAIPVSAIASMEHGIRLKLTKQEVEDLPPRGGSG